MHQMSAQDSDSQTSLAYTVTDEAQKRIGVRTLMHRVVALTKSELQEESGTFCASVCDDGAKNNTCSCDLPRTQNRMIPTVSALSLALFLSYVPNFLKLVDEAVYF